MKLSIPTLFLLGGGMLLVWGGITDRNPIAVLKAVLTGQSMPTAGSWAK